MTKKALGMFLIGASFLFYSCVDDTYDLKKDIDTDVEIKGNKLAFPLGTLRPFMLDSLVNDTEIVETMEDGVYCIKKTDVVQTEKDIEPITISIPSQSITQEMAINNPLAMGGDARVALPPIPLSIKKSFSFDNVVPNQFKRFYTCTFENKMPVELHLKIDGLDALQATSADLDFTIDFPAFFDGLTSDDAFVTIDANRVRIAKRYVADNSEGMVIKLYCPRFNFEKDESLGVRGLEPQESADGQTHLSHSSQIAVEGKMQLNDASPVAGGQNVRLGMTLELMFAPAAVQTVNGIFKDGFYKAESTFALDLGKKFRKFLEGDNEIKLSEPRIELELHNTVTVPLENIEIEISGKDKTGNTIPSTIVADEFEVESAQVDHETGEILASTTQLLLTANPEESAAEDFKKVIEAPNLVNWLDCVPDSMYYSVHPIIDTKRADIRINHTVRLSATYNASIPFKFERLHLVHSDTIPATLDLENEDDKTISNIGIGLKMNIANTTPLDVEIKIIALDEENKPINEIFIEESIAIEAASNKEVYMEIKGDDFSKLAKLKFDLQVEGEDVVLKNTHGIRVSNIALIIKGDIATNNK